MTDKDTAGRRRLSDDIEDRHLKAARDTVRRHGRAQVEDDLARGATGPAAGSNAFQDGLRRVMAERERRFKGPQNPFWMWLGVVFVIGALVLTVM